MIEAEITAILSDWTPLETLPRFCAPVADGWLVGGLYHGAPYVKHTGLIRAGHPFYGTDTPDDPIEAARWLDAHAKSRHAPQIQEATSNAQTDQFDQDRAGDLPGPGDRHVAAAEIDVRVDPGGDRDRAGLDGVEEQRQSVPEETAQSELVPSKIPDLEIGDPPPDQSRDFGGMMRDDVLSELSKEIDEIARWRRVASQDVIRNTPYDDLQSKNSSGIPLTDDEKIRERNYYDAQTLIQQTERFAIDLKAALGAMSDKALANFRPIKSPWPS